MRQVSHKGIVSISLIAAKIENVPIPDDETTWLPKYVFTEEVTVQIVQR